jgi:hypothetical protein
LNRLVQGLVERLVRALRGALGGRRRLAAAKGLAQSARNRRFYGRRCGFDEFALFIKPGENFLAADTEFLS